MKDLLLYAASAALTAAAGLTLSTGCAKTPDKLEQTTIVGPSRQQFIGDPADPLASVSGFLEVRCGSLDCHGTIGRPMRIYSGNGLRLPVDDASVSPGGLASLAERNANYDAVIGVEPERTTNLVNDFTKAANGDIDEPDPMRIYLVSKARGLVAHKGGAIVSPDDDGDLCITSWLRSGGDAQTTNLQACKRAANVAGN